MFFTERKKLKQGIIFLNVIPVYILICLYLYFLLTVTILNSSHAEANQKCHMTSSRFFCHLPHILKFGRRGNKQAMSIN